MSYSVKQGNIFGRIGSGLGSGLAEQLPQEIERKRLKTGLEALGTQKDLSPFQQFAKLSAIPGITPQMIQSGADLLRQQAKGQALQGQPQEKPINPFPEPKPISPTQKSEVPSLTQEKPFERFQEGYIPPTQDQIFEDAGRRYRENPALYANDPNKAIEAAENDAIRQQAIAESYQKKHENLSKIQDNVVSRLKNQSDRLGVKIPSNIYSKIEDQAIQATKPINLGGRGLTEQQAIKEYGNQLDEISRQYSDLDAIGDWGITGRPAKTTLSSIKDLQRKFEERGDTRNFADNLMTGSRLSPKLAYALAEPVSRDPKLNSFISKLPRVNETRSEEPIYETLNLSPKLAELLGTKNSPLAIAYELEKKGYDAQTWLNYLIDEGDNLNLTKFQDEQLRKPNPLFGTINDWWLSSWTGLNKEKD